jgi:predicted RND superfamily exporter protein
MTEVAHGATSIIDKYSNGTEGRYLVPLTILAIFVMAIGIAVYHGQDFALDASSDTLLDQNDPELQYYLSSRERFIGAEDFLVLTYTPNNGSIFTPGSLQQLARLQQRLEKVTGVASVYSILDAPLLKSPPMSIADLENGFRTLNSTDVDLVQARQELSNSPIFSNLIISSDGNTSALRVELMQDQQLLGARKRRDTLRQAAMQGNANNQEVSQVEADYRDIRDGFLKRRSTLLAEVGSIQDEFGNNAILHLGGVPSIANDIIEYVKSDLVVFSSSILLLIMLMLYMFFRRLRFVVIPTVASAISITLTVGVLGFIHQNVTIVSSNFVSILVITTISFCIHLIVRYRELRAGEPDTPQRKLVLTAMQSKLAPCIYTGLSTIAAFGSLLSSGIVPVRDFGGIICIGIVISFLSAYGLFAGIMLLLPKGKASATLHYRPILTKGFCEISTRFAPLILIGTAILTAPVVFGITRLSLDNSFIDYFRQDTGIHKGLKYIDSHLGGTTPFDIIIKFSPFEALTGSDDDFFDEAEDPFPERYWITPEKVELVRKLHDYIDSLPRTGKVLSISSLELVARDFNEGKPLGGLQMAGALGALPLDIRRELIDPYVSPESGEFRISVRIRESGELFSRDAMLEDIRAYARDSLDIADTDIHLTGMMVMFNNMLKELFNSQQSSIGLVIGLAFIMFIVLLRSVLLAIIGLLPNIFAAGIILAFMGFAGIPLDLMTITIAALVIGIGVDDAIHYLHRFRAEFYKTGNVIESVQRCHASTGHALYFTSITVIAGFSVLAFSNFVPTIHFGLLTSLAMIIALCANLALLPSMLVFFHPEGVAGAQ